MINPRNLCDDLNIDNCIAPQQLAIYIRKKHYNTDTNAYENGKPYYIRIEHDGYIHTYEGDNKFLGRGSHSVMKFY